MIRFIQMIKHKTILKGQLTVEEIKQAEICLIKYVQSQRYEAEILRLHAGKPVANSSSIRSLDPYLDDDGLLRVGGRLSESKYGCNHPCIIPPKHILAKAIIQDAHFKAHLGVEWTLSIVREKYWIIKARVMIKGIIGSCVMCKRLYAQPNVQKMADLPDVRLQLDKPVFTNVGIDFCGPFIVRIKRSDVKRYACIFTCLVFRAIHIEKVDCMDTASFINAVRRFVSRRGTPENIYSDNGANLVAGEKEMRQAIKELSADVIQSYAVKHEIKWTFIPPYAPHMGGVWERMVGILKRVLKGILPSNITLTDEVLETALIEVENIVNSRPLTKLSCNIIDPTPLTPNHLLLLRQGPTLPPGKFVDADKFRKRWRHVQHIANQFWYSFKRLYIPELQNRSKWFNSVRNLQKGDLVLISDENTPRNLWPLAIVDEIVQGRDGLVRSVRLHTRTTQLVRPVTKIVLLEGNII